MNGVVDECKFSVRDPRPQGPVHHALAYEIGHALRHEGNAPSHGDQAHYRLELLAFLHQLRLHVRLPTDLHQRIVVAGRVLPREEHERFLTQRAERDGALSRERVAFGKNGNERLTKDRHKSRAFCPSREAARIRRPAVLPAAAGTALGCQDLKDEVDVRVSFPERGQHSREYTQLGRCHVADGESTKLAPIRSNCDLGRTIGLRERAACLDEKQAAGICETNPPAGSLK